MLQIYHQIKMSNNKLTLKQNLLALIAALLFSTTSAAMDTAPSVITLTPNTVITPTAETVITLTAGTAPSAHETFLPTRDPVSVTQNPA